jgi:hypothetical protein
MAMILLLILQMWVRRHGFPDPAALLLCVLGIAALLLSLMLPLWD